MAMQEVTPAPAPAPSPSPAPSAEVVGNAFVEQYYHILHESPNLVHRFYQDSSFLSRPDGNGAITTVTTMEAINEKILSLNYEDYTAEIKTADAQESYDKGVIVLVTGCLTGKDGVTKKFTQTFFLAPQDKGYYVLNDVFRYIEDKDTLQSNPVSEIVNEIEITEKVPEPEAEVKYAPEQPVADPAASVEVEHIHNGAEVDDPLDNEGEGSVIDEEVVEPPTELNQNNIVTSVDSTPVAQDDAQRKSYAAIVMKSNAASGPVYVPSRTVRMAYAKPSQQLPAAAKPTPGPEAPVPNNDSAPESSDVHEEAEGHSIYVRNLPFNATVEQLEEVFKKFGPIKHDGIQVRSSKGFCFGFVEFEELSSMQSALEAAHVTIGGRQAAIEEKERLLESAVVVGEGGILPEEVTSEVRALGAEGNLAAAEVMEEVNSETRESFPGGLRVHLDQREIVLYRQAKMEVDEAAGKAGEDRNYQPST